MKYSWKNKQRSKVLTVQLPSARWRRQNSLAREQSSERRFDVESSSCLTQPTSSSISHRHGLRNEFTARDAYNRSTVGNNLTCCIMKLRKRVIHWSNNGKRKYLHWINYFDCLWLLSPSFYIFLVTASIVLSCSSHFIDKEIATYHQQCLDVIHGSDRLSDCCFWGRSKLDGSEQSSDRSGLVHLSAHASCSKPGRS